MRGLALCAALAPGAAGATPLEGNWCHPEHGGVLVIEAGGVGIGEHVVCDWLTAPGSAHRLNAELMCREWRYTGGDDPVLVRQGRERVALRLVAPDRLHTVFEGAAPAVMDRCEW